MIGALIVDVETEIDVQPAISVVIGGGGAGKGPLRRPGELKRVRLTTKLAAALVEEQKRTVGTNDYQVLPAVVIQVSKQCAGRVLQNSQPGAVGNVFERPVSSVSK